jgi:hypothetical protein
MPWLMSQGSGRAEGEQSREFIESWINTIDESQKEKVTVSFTTPLLDRPLAFLSNRAQCLMSTLD